MQNFSEYANTLRRKMKFSKEKTIFVCIGSNKVVWDSIGPYVGSILKEKIGEKYVIGDLENNICSQKDLKSYYPIVKNKFVVAIDSAITENNLSGEIFVTEKPIVMGMGVYQNKGIVGNIGIKAGIDRDFCSERYVLDISKIIAEGICGCSPFRDGSQCGSCFFDFGRFFFRKRTVPNQKNDRSECTNIHKNRF